MNLRPAAFGVVGIVIALAGCAEPNKPVRAEKAVSIQVGAPFNAVGAVSLHAGQPCASQIMFDFRRANSTRTISLAANAKDEKSLSDATTCDCAIHVVGIWRRGSSPNCYYVSVISAVRDQ